MTEPNEGPGSGSDVGAMDHVRAALQTPGGKILAVVPPVVALIVGGALGAIFGGGGGGSTPSAGAPGPTITVTAPGATSAISGDGGGTGATGTGTGTGTGTPTGTGTGSQPATPLTPNTTEIGVVPLSDLTPAGGAWKSQDANPMLNGTLQQFTIAQDLQDANNNGDVGYNLGRDYTKFTGLIGLDDNSAKSTLHPTIEIDGDGDKIATFTPTLGHPAQINLDVSGVLRLDIKYVSLDSDGIGSIAGTLILGNGQLTTVAGYHPPPPSSS